MALFYTTSGAIHLSLWDQKQIVDPDQLASDEAS